MSLRPRPLPVILPPEPSGSLGHADTPRSLLLPHRGVVA